MIEDQLRIAEEALLDETNSVRQQRELYEPSPSNVDWPRSQGKEDAMHNSQRAEVAEALIPSSTKEDPPTARNGRPTASGMSAGVTAATADEDGPVAPLSGETTPMKAEARVPHPAELLALQVPSKWILEAAVATSRDQA
jgi:hypothetical protein